MRGLQSVLVVLVAVASGGKLVRASNGDYAGDYHLTGYVPPGGGGAQPGSEVVFRGVQVGRVSTISLVRRPGQGVRCSSSRTFKVPADATATIDRSTSSAPSR